MIGCPQRRHGSVERGGKSPGMKTLASHPGQVTIFNGLSLIFTAGRRRRRPLEGINRPVRSAQSLLFCNPFSHRSQSRKGAILALTKAQKWCLLVPLVV